MNPPPYRLASRHPLWTDMQQMDPTTRWREPWRLEVGLCGHLHLGTRPCPQTTRLRSPPTSVESSKPLPHRSRSMQIMPHEMGASIQWPVWLWWDPDNVSHCQCLSPDEVRWRTADSAWGGWSCCWVAQKKMNDTWKQQQQLAQFLCTMLNKYKYYYYVDILLVYAEYKWVIWFCEVFAKTRQVNCRFIAKSQFEITCYALPLLTTQFRQWHHVTNMTSLISAAFCWHYEIKVLNSFKVPDFVSLFKTVLMSVYKQLTYKNMSFVWKIVA